MARRANQPPRPFLGEHWAKPAAAPCEAAAPPWRGEARRGEASRGEARRESRLGWGAAEEARARQAKWGGPCSPLPSALLEIPRTLKGLEGVVLPGQALPGQTRQSLEKG
ncbi:hypothetical protein PHLCEN_2v11062 [Hermanssonia centrifuga]|uniref:Uncharacterized protein n=1 Tax=Hermanssonia centrifuga TaxID=98765 RepID=A0A2R6NL03_9APHY|nr:hypothetical protein PHLCEN_2v11062 [Hermanssonia centrifuga]